MCLYISDEVMIKSLKRRLDDALAQNEFLEQRNKYWIKTATDADIAVRVLKNRLKAANKRIAILEDLVDTITDSEDW